MGANVTVYCLQNVTDYFEFERLCHDLMSLEGYSSIEPLGGFKDKGRDAIHVNKSDRTTIFAYSVREDWRAKLAEDASNVGKHGHMCDQLVFITTATFTAGERDEAVTFIHNEFGEEIKAFGRHFQDLKLHSVPDGCMNQFGRSLLIEVSLLRYLASENRMNAHLRW